MSAAAPSLAGELLGTSAPRASAAEAQALARTHFGIDGHAEPLTSERDQNFRLLARDGQTYVLKIANAAEDEAVVDLQTRALLHVAADDPQLPVPRAVPAVSGGHTVRARIGGGADHFVRVVTYLDGTPVSAAEPSLERVRDGAACLARLDKALAGLDHGGVDYELLWDIKRAPRVRDLVRQIEDAERRSLAERFLDNFEANAAPVRPRLRAQVIHNDFNPHNVLVDPRDPARVTGIIDFGDMVRSPLVDDVAVAASYQSGFGGDPLSGAEAFVAAYHAALPLSEAEVDILFDLIAVRHVMTVAITEWRARRYPANSAYILKNNPRAWAGLHGFAALSRRDAQRRLRRACAME